MIRFYFAFAVAISIGTFAGYGALQLSKIAFEKISEQGTTESIAESDLIDKTDCLESVEEPVVEEKIKPAKETGLFSRDIKIISQVRGYNKINKDIFLPKVSAKSIYIADMKTGEVIAEVEANFPRPIASISKLMTALVAKRFMNPDNVVTVSTTAVATYGKQGNLIAGEKLSIGDLMYALLLQSSNDASEVIAEHYGRENFIEKMNDEAKRIDLDHTEFDDPSGLSEKNISTAKEVFMLARYLYRNYPDVIEITQTDSYKANKHLWFNNSVFRGDVRYLGGKNGYTDSANYTLISIFKLPLGEHSEMREIGIVILKSDDSEKDMRSLILYLLRNIKFVQG